MKKLSSHALVLLLATCAFVMAPVQRSNAGEKSSTAAQKAAVGSLVLKCSPVFPDFLGLDVTIDGKVVGGFTKGHVFKTSIPAGTHQITVSENGRKIDEFQGKLDVQPGGGYSYVVSYGVDQVVLEPLGSASDRRSVRPWHHRQRPLFYMMRALLLRAPSATAQALHF